MTRPGSSGGSFRRCFVRTVATAPVWYAGRRSYRTAAGNPGPRRKVHFRIVGVLYATQNHIEDIFSDSLTFQAGLLDELELRMAGAHRKEINNCEKAALV